MPDVRELAADALVKMEKESVHVRDVVEALRGAVTDPRDRALLTEILYGVARRRPSLDHLIGSVSSVAVRKLDPAVRAALRLGLYQALFLERVPPHAAVDTAVRYAKARANQRLAGFVNGVLRGLLRSVEGPASGAEDPDRDLPRPGTAALRFRRPAFPMKATDPAANLGARYSHPAWLVRRWLDRFGPDVTEGVLARGIERPSLVLRARPGAREALLAELAASGVAARVGEGPEEVICPGGDALALLPVKEGRASVQDGTAQRVAALARPREGDRILDLCAAPGGKTLHLLELLGARGEVVAADSSAEKVVALAAVLEARPRPPELLASACVVGEEGPLPFPPASFDVVVVDAPCSNTGVLRRRPEVRTRLEAQDVASLAAIQRTLLERALPLLRPGGRLVYATCSVEPEEGEELARAFLAAHPGLVRGPGFDVLPDAHRDGGFAATFEPRAD